MAVMACYKQMLALALVSVISFSVINGQAILPNPYPSGAAVNFIRTWDATAPETNGNVLMTRPLKDVKMTTQYFDGLGRPLQTVVKQGSFETNGTAVDLVSPVVYDEFGREKYKYLPFAANNTGGNSSISDGAFKLNPFQQQATFMNAQYGSQNETWFYSQTNFEASPLNRVEKTMAPGNSWAGSSRGVEVKYWINTPDDDVKIWNVNNSGSNGVFGTYTLSSNNNGKYPVGELYKNVTVDEHQKQVIEFKDKEGKVILKKVQLTATADNGTGKNYDGWLCTYYIYDDLNNLRCVVQPEAVKKMSEAQNWSLTSYLNEQCFRYEYDYRNRMIMKKVPGAGEVYMVYDARDRLVMTQDANLRQQGKWMLTKYENNLNRPVETGLLINTTPFSTHLTAAAGSTNYLPAGTYEMLTQTYYDTYTGLPSPLSSSFLTTWNSNFQATNNNDWPYPQMPLQSNATRGMVTWTKVKILNSNPAQYITAVNIYDDKGRVIQVQSLNSTGGLDVITTQYTWAGQPLVTVQKQEKAGTNAQTTIVVTKLSYDDLGRLVKTEKKQSHTLVEGNAMSAYSTISSLEYDKLGQLKKKSIGSKKDINNNYITPRQPLEELAYEYNIRGWMLGMNRDYAKDANNNNWFGFDLGYDKPNNNIIGNQLYSNPQFNGNIEGMVWKSKGDGEKRKYDFYYDAANRILKADFTQYTGGAFNQSAGINYNMKMGDGNDVNTAYDANGNIKQMQQWGWKIMGSQQIDNMLYSYYTNSNKLSAVTEQGNGTVIHKLGDFTDKNTTGNDYGYDKNGNMVTDLNKEMNGTTGLDITTGGAIIYNHLNLPSVITVTGKGNITYTYDAAGNKLKKVTSETNATVPYNGTNYTSNIVTTTTYLGAAVFESKDYVNSSLNTLDYTDRLQFIGQEEGRIRFKQENNTLHYDYMLKDHLGNVRVVLTEEQQTDAYPPASMETAQSATENLYYSNINNTRTAKPSGYPADNYTNPNAYAAKVRGDGQKIGPAMILKVMAGDKFNVRVNSWYKTYGASPGTPVNPFNDLLSILTNSIGGITTTHGGVTTAELQNSGVLTPGVTNFLNSQSYNSSKPKAFINWIFLDEQFKYYAGSFDQVGNNEEFKTHLFNDVPVNKSGYLYIYVSNETPNIDVFFDNLQVTHIRGPLISEESFYPFGLSMSGISSKSLNFGNPENKIKFQGQEFASKEFSDGSGLEMYEFKWRMHDPQIGRFWQIDPLANDYVYNSTYAFSENKVTAHVELEGLESVPVNSNNPYVRGLFSPGTQKQMTEFNKNASEAVKVKITTGSGVGGSVQVPGGKLQIGANGPQTSVTTNLAGDTKVEGNLAGAGGEFKAGPLKLNAGTSVGNVEMKDGQVKVDPIKSGAGLAIESSKEVKQEGTSVKGKANLLDATIAVGAHIGYVGIEVSANVVKGGKAVVNFFGSIIEWGKSLVKEKTQNFGGSHDFVPK